MNNNNSTAYGNYGGVSNQNFYTPPAVQDFVPQPATAPFTEADRENLRRIAINTEFYAQNADNIMLRTSVSDGTKDTFTITTSANPADKIIYTVDKAVQPAGVDLNVVNGGFF